MLATDITNVTTYGPASTAEALTQTENYGFSFDYSGFHYVFRFTGQTTTVWEESATPLAPPTDADAQIAAGAGSDAVTIGSTADTLAEAAMLLDVTLSDGGGGDAVALSVTSLDVAVTGTAAAIAPNLTWLLNGPDATNVAGTFSGGKVTFAGLGIEVADAASETYAVSAYFSDNTGLTDGDTLIIGLDADVDVTVASGSTTFAPTAPVRNAGGAIIDVTATMLAFTTQPAGSISGAALDTQPVVAAQDAAGNTDIDFSARVSLGSTAPGTLSGNESVAAVAGVATFTGVTYAATADQQDFTLDALAATLPAATSAPVTSDVVATRLVFATEPAPDAFNGNQLAFFTTFPVIHAVDAAGLLDEGYAASVSISAVDALGSAFFSETNTPFISGIAVFGDLSVLYSNSGTTTETFKIEASSGSLDAAQSTQLTARLAPVVLGVSTTMPDAFYGLGQTILVSVTFSEPVAVTGVPQLLLELGVTDRPASYASGSGTDVLTFSYPVQQGDTTDDLDYATGDALSRNGGTIVSVANAAAAALELATPGQPGSLSALATLAIDTTAPVGYSVQFDQGLISDANRAAVSFTLAGAEPDTGYDYTISSSGGGEYVTGFGGITTATESVTGIDVSQLADGVLTLSVTLVDPSQNTGEAATATVAKDATMPSGHSVAFVEPAVNDANRLAIGFDFADAEVGAAYSYMIESSGGRGGVGNVGTIGTATDQVAGIDVSGLPDGTLTLSVVLTDTAGNEAPPVTATIAKDTRIPVAGLRPRWPSHPTLAARLTR